MSPFFGKGKTDDVFSKKLNNIKGLVSYSPPKRKQSEAQQQRHAGKLLVSQNLTKKINQLKAKDEPTPYKSVLLSRRELALEIAVQIAQLESLQVRLQNPKEMKDGRHTRYSFKDSSGSYDRKLQKAMQKIGFPIAHQGIHDSLEKANGVYKTAAALKSISEGEVKPLIQQLNGLFDNIVKTLPDASVKGKVLASTSSPSQFNPDMLLLENIYSRVGLSAPQSIDPDDALKTIYQQLVTNRFKSGIIQTYEDVSGDIYATDYRDHWHMEIPKESADEKFLFDHLITHFKISDRTKDYLENSREKIKVQEKAFNQAYKVSEQQTGDVSHDNYLKSQINDKIDEAFEVSQGLQMGFK